MGKINAQAARPALQATEVSRPQDVQCSASLYCDDGYHCCYNQQGYPSFCCENGYTCDAISGTCDSAAGKKVNAQAARPALQATNVSHPQDVQCSASLYCDDGYHCCYNQQGYPDGC